MKFTIESEIYQTEVDLEKASVAISEAQGVVNEATPMVFGIAEGEDNKWKDNVLLDPYGSTDLKKYIRGSLAKNNVPDEEINIFLNELFSSGSKTVEVETQETVQPEVEPEPKKVKNKKAPPKVGEAQKIENTAQKQTVVAGKKAIAAVASWKVVLITLFLPLVYFSALILLIKTVHFTNLWVIIALLFASALVLCWYLSVVIKASQRKVLEKTVTKEVFTYVGQEQLNQKARIERQIQSYNDLFGDVNNVRLSTPEGAQSAKQLLDEMAELQDESTL